MSVFGKLFDPSGKGSEEAGSGEGYDPATRGAEVDLDAGVLILPDYGAAEPTAEPEIEEQEAGEQEADPGPAEAPGDLYR